jgi:NAD-dependent DNA ligase
MRHPDKKKKKDKHEDKKERENKKDKKDKDRLPSFTDDLAELKKKYSRKLIVSDLGIKVDAFKGIESVDDETAALIYDNGFTSIEDLKNATAKDLIKIKGIKRKKAKKIIKELSDSSSEELSQVSNDRGEMGAVK